MLKQLIFLVDSMYTLGHKIYSSLLTIVCRIKGVDLSIGLVRYA
jgi:hypothetical protein